MVCWSRLVVLLGFPALYYCVGSGHFGNHWVSVSLEGGYAWSIVCASGFTLLGNQGIFI